MYFHCSLSTFVLFANRSLLLPSTYSIHFQEAFLLKKLSLDFFILKQIEYVQSINETFKQKCSKCFKEQMLGYVCPIFHCQIMQGYGWMHVWNVKRLSLFIKIFSLFNHVLVGGRNTFPRRNFLLQRRTFRGWHRGPG